MTLVIYFRDRRAAGELYPGFAVESAVFNAPFRWRSSGAFRMRPASNELLIQPPEGLCTRAFAAGENGTARAETFVVAVHSAPHHFENRLAIRATWARDSGAALQTGGTDVLVVFAMGQPSASPRKQQTQLRIASEAALYRDVIQGSFPGTFSASLPLNAITLKWVSIACPQASYVVKVSDDSFVNVWRLRELLGGAKPRSPTVYAHIYQKPSVWNGHRLTLVRNNICVACGYAVSGDAVNGLLNRAMSGGFISVEHLFWNVSRDRVAPVKLVNMRAFSTTRGLDSDPLPCGVKNAIASHHLSAGSMYEAWKALHNDTAPCDASRTALNIR
ncbi:hypothetical protein HPB48_008166 [Haemaphysalis longicornis]|uniref:Hexosyltransferase n=1 Tax=Haemaphysalis longicornis TaxID=44386 RepID=A0A9J6H0V5_HAELO|nr:hypothetical protein HPB48_008166 [Haemaphysalis longicornis]